MANKKQFIARFIGNIIIGGKDKRSIMINMLDGCSFLWAIFRSAISTRVQLEAILARFVFDFSPKIRNKSNTPRCTLATARQTRRKYFFLYFKWNKCDLLLSHMDSLRVKCKSIFSRIFVPLLISVCIISTSLFLNELFRTKFKTPREAKMKFA